MNSSVQQIKDLLPIEDVVSSYVKLEPAGKNLKTKCPFHNEKTPSFFVSPERGSYYCFGCGASGDIFTFVEEFEGLDFRGALRLLADRAGVSLPAYEGNFKKDSDEKEKLYEVIEEATKFFESNLKGNKSAQDYLKSRGLDEKTIKDFRIGFAILDWRTLYDYLKSKKFTDEEIEIAGLAKTPSAAASSPLARDRTSGGLYDRFRGRIMFPIADSSGRIIAFSGRLFEAVSPADKKAQAGAKYINSPETPIFHKNAVLYGLDKAKNSIRKNNFSILVEGQMDLVLSHQAGYKNTVAASGTALSESTLSQQNSVSNLGLVRRLSPNIVLAFDADKAGFNACLRAGRIALTLGMDVKAVSIPEGIDPADLISQQGGKEKWRDAVRNSKSLIEFMLERVLETSGGDMHKAGRLIQSTVLPFVAALPSSIEKMHFIKKISDSASVPEIALLEDLRNLEKEDSRNKEAIEEHTDLTAPRSKKDFILRRILSIVFWQESLAEPALPVGKILEELREILNDVPEQLLASARIDAPDLIFEAEVLYEDGANLKKDLSELLRNLRQEHLKDELGRKMRELHLAEEQKDTIRAGQILKECQIINNQIEVLKNEHHQEK